MRKLPCIFDVQNRIRRLPFRRKIEHLKKVRDAEPPRSIRRSELQALIDRLMWNQLRKAAKENKAA